MLDMVKGLRREIAEFRADQTSIEVSLIIENHSNNRQFRFQATNKNLVAQAEELVKDRTNQADVFAQKLEEKLLRISGSKPDFEKQVSGSLNQLKADLKSLLDKGVRSSGVGGGGLSDADKAFLKDLSNDTIDAIQDMRLEVLTASDKSEFRSFKR